MFCWYLSLSDLVRFTSKHIYPSLARNAYLVSLYSQFDKYGRRFAVVDGFLIVFWNLTGYTFLNATTSGVVAGIPVCSSSFCKLLPNPSGCKYSFLETHYQHTQNLAIYCRSLIIHFHFADTWPKFMVGCETLNITGWISVKKYPATCGLHWNISHALHSCADIPVSFTFSFLMQEILYFGVGFGKKSMFGCHLGPAVIALEYTDHFSLDTWIAVLNESRTASCVVVRVPTTLHCKGSKMLQNVESSEWLGF